MWAISESCLHHETPLTTLDTGAQVSFPGWQYSTPIVIDRCQEGDASQLHRKDTGSLMPGTLSDPTHASLPLAGFNLYPFPVVNCNHEYESSPWVL